MTRVQICEKTCFVCGTNSRQPKLVLANGVHGRPDLDTRPPEQLRSTIHGWVQRCPSCGYCATHISEGRAGVEKPARLLAYHVMLDESALPPLAATFMCQAFILQFQGKVADAGMARLRAAWVCDDAGEVLRARVCRRAALDLFEEAQRRKQGIEAAPVGETALMVDVLRRARQFREALSMAAAAIRVLPHGAPWLALRYQLVLASREEDGCFTLGDALGDLGQVC